MLHELGKKYLIDMPGLCFQEPLSALWFVLCSLFFLMNLLTMSCKNQSMFMCPTIHQSFCWSLFGLVKEVQHSVESDLIACRFEIKIYTLKNTEPTSNQTAVNCLSDQSEKGTCTASTIHQTKRDKKNKNDYQK